jgi:hypothetical protein
MNKSTLEIYKECSEIEYSKRTDAEKAVVWQYNANKWLYEQIKALQKTNLIDVTPGVHIRKFSGEGLELSLDSNMELYCGWDIDGDKVMDSLEVVKSMIKVTTSGDNVYDGAEIHYQLVINFNNIIEMGG